MDDLIQLLISSGYPIVLYRTVIIFLYAFLLLRLLGRRRLSHLTYIDILLIISFGSAVGDTMIYNDDIIRLPVAMTAITIVAIIVRILDEFSERSITAQHVLEGSARLLIDKGKVLPSALQKENINENTLQSMLREHDIYDLTHVRKAFIEPDGELSIMLYKGNHKLKE